MLKSAEETLQMIGVAVTVALFALFWALRGKLNTMGLEYIHWNRTPAMSIACAIALGVAAGAVIAWWFRSYDLGKQPPFAELWVAVTWGPLIEEVIFRGYLFSLLERFPPTANHSPLRWPHAWRAHVLTVSPTPRFGTAEFLLLV